ncbi:hypothetical protein GGI21_001627 [Coemansia aciculifera]|nr:hypothetical protein GGI21_001627 [Coemansia aciculifera]
MTGTVQPSEKQHDEEKEIEACDVLSQRVSVYSPDLGLRHTVSVEEALVSLKGKGDEWTWIHVTGPSADESSALAAAIRAPAALLSEEQQIEDLLANAGGVRAVSSARLIVSVDYNHNHGLVAGVVRRQRLRPGGTSAVARGLQAAAAEAVARAVEAEVAAIEQQTMHETGGTSAQLLRRIGGARRTVLGAWRLCMGGGGGGGGGGSGRLLAACVHCEAALSRAHSQCAAQLAVNQSQASAAWTAISNRWMVLATILLPFHFIAGLLGMNVYVPWKHIEQANNNTNAWLGVLACLLFVLVVTFFVVRFTKFV